MQDSIIDFYLIYKSKYGVLYDFEIGLSAKGVENEIKRNTRKKKKKKREM